MTMHNLTRLKNALGKMQISAFKKKKKTFESVHDRPNPVRVPAQNTHVINQIKRYFCVNNCTHTVMLKAYLRTGVWCPQIYPL